MPFFSKCFHVAPLLLSVCAVANQLPEGIVLRNATLIDGSGLGPRQGVDIVLRAGLVESISPSSTKSHTGLQSVDCTNKIVMPGLISAHSHVGVLQDNVTNTAAAFNRANVIAALNQFERYGVTTVVTLGMNRDLIYTLRDEQRAGSLGDATILTAGRGVGVTDGAPPQPAAPDQVDHPKTADEARHDVDAYVAHHADIVKLWLDPLGGKVPEMNTEIYIAVIDQAHKRRLPVAAHMYALSDAKQLVADGIDVIAHSVRDQPVDEVFIDSMLQHHTWYIPTLALDEAFYIYALEPEIMGSQFFQQAAGPELLTKLHSEKYATGVAADPTTKQHQQDEVLARKNLKTLFDAGVRVASGTDSGASPGRIPGFSEHRELQDLVAAGLTPLEAIADSTGRTGELIHELDSRLNVGIIAPGYSADVVILGADPSVNILNTRKIVAVYHHGVAVKNPAPQN